MRLFSSTSPEYYQYQFEFKSLLFMMTADQILLTCQASAHWGYVACEGGWKLHGAGIFFI